MNLDQQADVGEFWASLEKALVDMGEETCLMHSACLPIIADAIAVERAGRCVAAGLWRGRRRRWRGV